MYKVILTAMIVFLLSAVSAHAFVEVRHDRLEVDGKMLGKAVNEREMGEIRGGFMGFSFSALFQGWWNSLGSADSSLHTTTGTPSDTGNDTPGEPVAAKLPANPTVNIQASVGEMGGARGVFQIVQVPGSNNLVVSTLNVNIQIIQVLGGVSIADLRTMLPWSW